VASVWVVVTVWAGTAGGRASPARRRAARTIIRESNALHHDNGVECVFRVDLTYVDSDGGRAVAARDGPCDENLGPLDWHGERSLPGPMRE
jgi:hypothetical protein